MTPYRADHSDTRCLSAMLTRSILAFVAALYVVMLSAGCHAADPTNKQPPNIVFILADDLGWRDLSNEGSVYYETPNIDAIAARGMKFTRGYAACRVCSPSRASILTGTYPTRHGITTWIGDRSGEAWRQTRRHDSHFPAGYLHGLGAEETTLAEVLRGAGYATFFAGKWHLGSEGSWPTDHGFEINKGGWDLGWPEGGFFSPFKNPNLESGPPGESLTLRLANETNAFIEARRDRPFFVFLSFYAVHGPIQTTPQLWKKYRDKAASAGLADSRFIFDRRLGVRQVQDCPVYAGMIETMDDAVGLVLVKLEELGLEDNTVICFTSDNGGVSSGDAFSTSNLPLRGGKGRQWEGGIRVPYYILAPGKTQAGSTSDLPVHGIDWYPTILGLAGVDTPPGLQLDGASLAPLLNGESVPGRPLFWHYPHYGNQGGEPSSIILRSNWKLIHYHEDGRDELYNIAEDIGEQQNRAATNPDIAKSLRRELDAWLEQSNAAFPSPDPRHDPSARSRLWERRATRGLKNLENYHARYLDTTYKPNDDWWGSVPINASSD